MKSLLLLLLTIFVFTSCKPKNIVEAGKDGMDADDSIVVDFRYDYLHN